MSPILLFGGGAALLYGLTKLKDGGSGGASGGGSMPAGFHEVKASSGRIWWTGIVETKGDLHTVLVKAPGSLSVPVLAYTQSISTQARKFLSAFPVNDGGQLLKAARADFKV